MISPQKIAMQVWKWFSDLDWRILVILAPLSLIVLLSLSSSTAFTAFSSSFPSFASLKSLFYTRTTTTPNPPPLTTVPTRVHNNMSDNESVANPFGGSRIAVCLVGGARRFELTGPSIVDRILKVYPNSDLFLHSPLDSNAFKFSLLNIAPNRIAAVRIFAPKPIPETQSQVRVLTPSNSPNGIQGLLQYFHLVEGCLTMIKAYQTQNNFTYDWIIRTRVDGYWSAPLGPENFIPGQYIIPPGSSYGGLNDRLGIGDLKTSTPALSRLSLISQLDSAGFRRLNSEAAFRAQLTTNKIPYVAKRIPFCVVSDRQYNFPPVRYGVPVAAMSSPGPLNGAKCRPCKAACGGNCVGKVMGALYRGWSWTDWSKGSLQLCDAHGEWEKGWEKVFDGIAGKELATVRKWVLGLKMKQCVDEFEKMKGRTGEWEVPPAVEICRLGLGSR